MTDSQRNSGSPIKNNWLKKHAVALLASFLVIAVTIALFVFQDNIKQLGNYGYLGAFFISVLTNATVILPMPSLILIFPLGAAFNPFFIGLAAGVGGALGEMTAYVVGYSGRGLWRDNPGYLKAVNWLKKWGMLVVFLFSVSPMPLDLMGLASGNLRLPAWKFLIPCLPGKIIKYVLLAYLGAWGWDLFITDPAFRNTLYVVTCAVIIVVVLLGLALYLEKRSWRRGGKTR